MTQRPASFGTTTTLPLCSAAQTTTTNDAGAHPLTLPSRALPPSPLCDLPSQACLRWLQPTQTRNHLQHKHPGSPFTPSHLQTLSTTSTRTLTRQGTSPSALRGHPARITFATLPPRSRHRYPRLRAGMICSRLIGVRAAGRTFRGRGSRRARLIHTPRQPHRGRSRRQAGRQLSGKDGRLGQHRLQ